jgi:hypothetical protein
MRRKQLILLVAIMVLGLYGCKKKEPIETQPSIESITPTESEQELSSEDIQDAEMETFSFDASRPKEGVRLDENGETYGEEELAAIESSERAERDELIKEQGSGDITVTTSAEMENMPPEEVMQAIQESVQESLQQREDYETISDEEVVRMANDLDNYIHNQALDMKRVSIMNQIKEKQANGIHDFDHITEEVLAGYTEEQLRELNRQLMD